MKNFNEFEKAVNPEALRGMSAYNDLVVGENFVDNKGIFWGQRSDVGDDYLPHLRAPLQVQWTYSKLCNFSCNHCFNGSGPDWKGFEADPILIADRLIAAQPYNVCMCGGEPLVWKPIYEIIERLRVGGVPLVSTVSNGYQATAENIARLFDSGCTNLQISLDGFTPEHATQLRVKNDCLERASSAVREAKKYPWTDLSVSFTPTIHNVGTWKDFCRFWADQGIDHIRTQPMMPIGEGRNAPHLMPTDEQYQQFHLDTIELGEELPRCFVDWGDPLEHIWFYTQTPATPWSCGVQTNGWYELSCYIPVLVGSALEHSFEEWWEIGLSRLWNAPVVRRFAETLTHMGGMAELEIEIYKADSLHIDVFDERQLQIFLETDDLDVLGDLSRQNLDRYMSRWAA